MWNRLFTKPSASTSQNQNQHYNSKCPPNQISKSNLPVESSSTFQNATQIALDIDDYARSNAKGSDQFKLKSNPKIVLSLHYDVDYYFEDFENVNVTRLYLHLDECDQKRVSLRYRMSILNNDDGQSHVQEGRADFAMLGGGWRHGALYQVSRQVIFKSENLLEDGTLTFCCEVEQIQDDDSDDQKIENSVSKTLSKIRGEFHSFLESGKLSDAVLVLGEKKFPIHKVILSGQSPVFAAMFTNSSTKEAQENRVEIEDVQLEVLEEMLKYIYTGKVESLDRFAQELLVVADRYQLEDLKKRCENHFCDMITTESISDLFLLSDMYQCARLNSKCLDYITENSAEVMQTEGWTKVAVRPDLMVKLFQKFSIKYNDKVIKN